MIMLALVSCAKVQEENIDSPEEVTPVSVKSLVVNTVIPETKVTISPDGDEYKMSWDGDESAKLVERSDAAANASLYTSRAIDVTAGKAAFTFDGLTPVAGTTVYNYDILYPASAVGAATGDVIAMTMPATQTPGASSPDGAASLLAGRNATDFDAQPASVNANFNHLAAYGKMTLKNLSKGSLETVTSISITIEAEECNIAGDLEYDAETGVADYNSSSESVITINGTNLTWVYGGFDVWFACKPFTLPAGKKLIITTTLNGTLVQTATMVAKADVDFNAGEVTEFPAFGTTYTVTFNTNGGSAIAPAYVGRENKVKKPADPTKTTSLVAGLYDGVIADPDNIPMVFDGWYSDSACTTPFDFDSQIWGNTTIYANWTESVTPVDMSGFTPTDAGKASDVIWLAFDYLNGQTFAEETDYTIVVAANNTYQQQLKLNNANAVVTMMGVGAERTLFHSWTGSVINAIKGHIILSNNITLSGTFGTSDEGAVYLSGGNVTMTSGSKIIGCTATGRASAVYNNSSDSTFILDGGEISGNTTTVPSGKVFGGAMSANWGKIIIKSGAVFNNETTSADGNITIGGAGAFPIKSRGNAFQKTGGRIYGNSAAYTGGATGDECGQQIIIGDHNNRASHGIYTVNDDLEESDNLMTNDRKSNPLWQTVVLGSD